MHSRCGVVGRALVLGKCDALCKGGRHRGTMPTHMPYLPRCKPQPQQGGHNERGQEKQREGNGGRAGGVRVWHV